MRSAREAPEVVSVRTEKKIGRERLTDAIGHDSVRGCTALSYCGQPRVSPSIRCTGHVDLLAVGRACDFGMLEFVVIVFPTGWKTALQCRLPEIIGGLFSVGGVKQSLTSCS